LRYIASRGGKRIEDSRPHYLAHDFCLREIFFLFLVGRNSANFAPRGERKLFAGWRLARGGGAKLSEFRPGGGAKLFPGGAKFVWVPLAAASALRAWALRMVVFARRSSILSSSAS
jgi:hypothetical protein